MNNLKNRFKVAGCLIILLTFCACQKVIDLNLGNNTPKYVIEAVVTNEHGGCGVAISQTKDFSDDNTFVGVSGATVTLESNGISRQINATSPGLYQNAAIVGNPGGTYKLTVNIKGQVFTAICKMPPMVPFEQLYLTTDGSRNNKDGAIHKYASVSYTDPKNSKNYYRFVQLVNSKQEKTIFIANDEFTNGQTVNRTLNYDNDTDDLSRDIKTSDRVTVDMLCIDSAVYKYWYGLREGASGSSNNAAPSNPVTNIQGGALGYFSVHTIQHRTVAVP